ncbi:MAG: DALR domain-containing protein, partial [Balneolaceae bacterium]
HIMRWDSPWGEGFPGWHLECTTMSTKYLGKKFDIHGGGLDLQFPHHEAEIAQSRGAHGEDPVKYWMHNNMVTIDGAKMSKSAGNFINLEDLFDGNHELIEKGFSPMVVRFLMLQSHYRSKIDFSNDALVAAEKGYQKLMNAVNLLDKIDRPGKESDSEKDEEIFSLIERCHEAISDDFNTARVLAALFDITSIINALYNKQIDKEDVSLAAFTAMSKVIDDFVFNILGLTEETTTNDGLTEELVNLLIEIRSDARERKEFATSDKIRDDLQKIGIRLKDDKSGETTFEVI